MKTLKTLMSGFADAILRIVEKMGWRLIFGLALSVASLVLFGWLAKRVFEGELTTFDDSVRHASQQIATPVLTHIMIFFTYVGSVYGITGLFIIAVLLLLYFDKKREAALLAITMVGKAVLGIFLKLSYQRPRPETFFGFEPPASYSFPSGHAFGSLCFFGGLALITVSRMKSRRSIAAVWIGAAFLIVTIGTSRIYLGVHYPSDILAGYLAGIIWLSAIYSVDHRLQRRSGNLLSESDGD